MAEDGIADSGRAWRRLAAATAPGTVGGVGMWSVVVVLSAVQAEFGVDRAAALPSTLTMLGFAVGGLATLLADALLQAAALALYPAFDDLTSLYVISALFGLFQGGIVPAYAIIVCEDLPAEEAGARIGAVLMATLAAMALGGWLTGVIFDATGSYRAAFVNGSAWNAVNVAIVLWPIRCRRARTRLAAHRELRNPGPPASPGLPARPTPEPFRGSRRGRSCIVHGRHVRPEEQAGLQTVADAVGARDQEGGRFGREVGGGCFLEQAEPSREVLGPETAQREMLPERIALVPARPEEDRRPERPDGLHVPGPVRVGDRSREDGPDQRVAAHAAVKGVEKAGEAGFVERDIGHDHEMPAGADLFKGTGRPPGRRPEGRARASPSDGAGPGPRPRMSRAPGIGIWLPHASGRERRVRPVT